MAVGTDKHQGPGHDRIATVALLDFSRVPALAIVVRPVQLVGGIGGERSEDHLESGWVVPWA